MPEHHSIAELYLLAVDSFTEFARTLDPDDWATPVPCTPARTARVTTGDVTSASIVTLRGATRFEMFRSRLGRRSRQQVRDAEWEGTDADIDAVLDHWFSFGPSPSPIEE